MLGSTDPGILFLKQEDVIAAGLLDMVTVMKNVETVYAMLGQGQVQNPPKARILKPYDQIHWNSFFHSMPAYLGGDINIAGIKWAAESKSNVGKKDIPYGIDLLVLSDPETVLPFAIMDGTLITAMRTSAVGGVFAKYCAPKNTTTATFIGCGVIGRTMIMAISAALPQLKKIYLCDLDIKKAEALANEYNGKYPAQLIPTTDSKAASLQSELVVHETTAVNPYFDASWVKKGATIIGMSGLDITLECVKGMDMLFVDYWEQMKTFKVKPITQLYDKGELKEADIHGLSDIISGKIPGRKNESETIYCGSLGLGALDVMVGYQMFKNAKAKNIGTKLNLWDKTLWV